MLTMTPNSPSFTSDPAADRRWRSAVLWTVHDLRISVVRRRKLSLPNLCRLFEYRWRKVSPGEPTAAVATDAGRAFLKSIYPKLAAAGKPANGQNSG
jgi:hypothetical protein